MVRRYLWAVASRRQVSSDTDWEPGDVTSSGFSLSHMGPLSVDSWPEGKPETRSNDTTNVQCTLYIIQFQFLKIKNRLHSLPLPPSFNKWAKGSPMLRDTVFIWALPKQQFDPPVALFWALCGTCFSPKMKNS